MKVLIVIDMQYDFIDGSLANPAAAAIVPGIAREMLKGEYDRIILTRDTHHESTYLHTPEGRRLPVLHCIYGTHGWDIHDDIMFAANHTTAEVLIFSKHAFGTCTLLSCVNANDDIYVVGTCTDICVLNNAIILKSLGCEVNVIGDLCAGMTQKLHEDALEMMKHNHINVISKCER